MDTNILTVKEAADMLKTSKQQVRKMIREGTIQAVKVGREYRIPESRIEEFFVQNMWNS